MLASDLMTGLCPVLLSRPDSLRGATLCIDLCSILMRAMLECGELVADLVPFDVIDFEVILGMDQLTRHYAIFDCREKVVIFRISNDDEFRFRGDKSSMPQNLIPAITTRKIAKKRMSGLLSCG